MRGVEGVARFLARVWRLMMRENQAGEWELSPAVQDIDLTKVQRKILHGTIKKVTQDIESLSFNTAISQMMIFVNAFTNAETIPLPAMRTFLVLLNPFAPHLSSDLWEKLRGEGDITEQRWPKYDDQVLVETDSERVVQVDGRFVGVINISVSASDEEAKDAAKALPKVPRNYVKALVVGKKVVNFVTK
jgi:leucyl-tRNA synthetase